MKLVSKYEYEKIKMNYTFCSKVIKKITFNKVKLTPIEELMEDYVVVNV